MEWNGFFQSLYNMAIGLIEIIGDVWVWLTKPLKVEFTWLKAIFPFDFVRDGLELSLKYSPLELLGVGISFLLVLWVIKHLIPLG